MDEKKEFVERHDQATSGDAPDETDAPPLDRLPLVSWLTDRGFCVWTNDRPNLTYMTGRWRKTGPSIGVTLWADGEWYAMARGSRIEVRSLEDLELAVIFLTLREGTDEHVT